MKMFKFLSVLLTVVMLIQVCPGVCITHAAQSDDGNFVATSSDSMILIYSQWANNTINFSFSDGGTNNTLFVKEHGGLKYRRYSYLKFSIAGAPEEIDEAAVNLTLTKSAAINETLYLHPVTEEWDSKTWEETYTYTPVVARPQPAFVNSLAGQISIPANTLNTTISIDVSDYIKSAVAEGKTEVSFRLSMSAQNNQSGATFLSERSTENGLGNAISDSEKPSLIIRKPKTTCNVDFYSNGGTAVESCEVAIGEAVEQSTVEREGYEFAGWYYPVDSQWTAWDFSTALSEDIALTAMWTPIGKNDTYDFESHPTEVLPIGWTNIGGASEFIPAVANVNGNNMVKLRSAYSGGVSGISKAFDSFGKNILNASFDFVTDDKWMDASMLLSDSNGNAACVVKAYHNNFYYTASDGSDNVLCAIADNTVYNIAVSVNFRKGTFDIIIKNGDTVSGSASDAKLLNSCNEVSSLGFVIDDIYAASDYMYVDNVVLNEQILSIDEAIGADFTDSNGNYVFTASAGDVITINATADSASLDCAIAYYIDDEKLDSVEIIPVSFENGTATVKVSDVTVSENISGGKIKVMLFEEIGKAHPYCKAVTLPIN